ncbi:hypothetical protein ACFQU7_35760 [Pseudoroseomonas wenyumeiae]
MAIAAAFLGLGMLAAPHSSAQDLTVGMQGEPGTLDPQFNLLGTNTSALRNVYDTLLSRDPSLQLRLRSRSPGARWTILPGSSACATAYAFTTAVS